MKQILVFLILFGAFLKPNYLYAQSNTDSIQDKSEVFAYVEQMPSFKGGEKKLIEFISQNVKYPEEAKEIGIQGTVFLSFIVDETGSLTQPKILKSIHPLLDKEALRVFNLMPKWISGKQNGKPVKVKMCLPVKFKLD